MTGKRKRYSADLKAKVALSAIEAVRAIGLRIPADPALVCFDDFVLADARVRFAGQSHVAEGSSSFEPG